MADETKDPREAVAWIVEHYHTQGGGPYVELWRAGRKTSAESQVESLREANPGDTVTMRALGYLDAADPIRCTCEWTHPVDGSVRSDWPAELDPSCPVHSQDAEPVEGEVALDYLRLRAALREIKREVDPDRMRSTGHIPDEERIWYLADEALNRPPESEGESDGE